MPFTQYVFYAPKIYGRESDFVSHKTRVDLQMKTYNAIQIAARFDESPNTGCSRSKSGIISCLLVLQSTLGRGMSECSFSSEAIIVWSYYCVFKNRLRGRTVVSTLSSYAFTNCNRAISH